MLPCDTNRQQRLISAFHTICISIRVRGHARDLEGHGGHGSSGFRSRYTTDVASTARPCALAHASIGPPLPTNKKRGCGGDAPAPLPRRRRYVGRAEPDDAAAERLLLREVEWATRWQWPAGPYMPIFRLARELGMPLVALNVADETLDRVSGPSSPFSHRKKTKSR